MSGGYTPIYNITTATYSAVCEIAPSNMWGAGLNTDVQQLTDTGDLVTVQQLNAALAALKPVEPAPKSAEPVLAGALVGAAVISEAKKPVSRKALFGWLRK